MIRTAVIGLGKMGLSHTAILGAHKDVELVAVCDSSRLVLNAFKHYNNNINTYDNYRILLENERLDAVIIATPTKFHFEMAKDAIEKGVNVFCEKPFSLTLDEGIRLVELVSEFKVINQVGYHNHFLGTFVELKRLIQKRILGELFHFTGEAYGPVITKPKGGNWRAKPSEGGGCLYDYASHVINLIQEIIGNTTRCEGKLLKKYYSKDVEDAVYSLLILDNGLSGVLSVNWSDETYRKMSTTLTIQGEGGKIICDATELKIYLKEDHLDEKLSKGWTIKYITDLTQPVDFYLRGEEYSAQIDYFIHNIKNKQLGQINTFEQALNTDRTIELIKS
ncbi:Gfo/Idh/MocA family protein [Namhaeicola litoreus]|uniref:Gfo/Idh/MocA family protein n=1 Tax=Namhaeicola litoreus TaxID=1052145 RepID=A0ABW3Y5Z6_9FLAO